MKAQKQSKDREKTAKDLRVPSGQSKNVRGGAKVK